MAETRDAEPLEAETQDGPVTSLLIEGRPRLRLVDIESFGPVAFL